MPGRVLERSFLQSYKEWTSKSEPPELFHVWTGIGILGAALGRKVCFPRGHYTLYPNIYTILIAGSAKCRKSTALRMGKQILQGLIDTHKVNLSANKVTPEMLVHELGKEATVGLPDTSAALVERGSECLLFATELTTLIDQKSFHNGLIQILTDLYDCPAKWKNETKNRGCDHLYDVFLGILGATTPDEMALVMPPQAIGSGFTSRVTFIYQSRPGVRIAHPEDFYNLPEMVDLKEKLIQDIKHIHGLKGEFRWGPGAKEYFTDWYESMPDDAEDEKMEGYLGRKHDHAIKLAMILTASRTDELVIDTGTLKGAIILLDEVEKFMSRVYSVLAEPNSIQGDVRWIMKHLLKNGGQMDHSVLLRRGWSRFSDAKAFADVIQSMIEAGMISTQLGTNKKKIYTVIADKGMVDSLMG